MMSELKTKMTDNQKIKAKNAFNIGRGASFVVYGDSRDDANSWIPHMQEIYKDAQGFPYPSVRYCNPDHIYDK
jgi:hypothetical protein